MILPFTLHLRPRPKKPLLPQTQHLNLVRPDNVTQVSGTVHYLDGITKGIYRVGRVFRAQPVVENTANAGGVDKVDEDVSADAVPRSFRRDEWQAEWSLEPQSAVGQENIDAVGVNLAEVAVAVRERKVDLDTVQRPVGELIDLGFVQPFKSKDRLIGELRRINAGSGEESHRQEVKQYRAHG